MPGLKSLFKPFRKSQDQSMSGSDTMASESKSSMRTEVSTAQSSDHMQQAQSATTNGTHATTTTASEPIVLVELFQSQGCSSCPPANANAIDLSCARDNGSASSGVHKVLASSGIGGDADVLLLTYHVTYWDYIGWRDTFGAKAWDERQRDYVRRMRLRSAFTPQIIVNGRASGVGSSRSDLARILRDGCVGAEGARAAFGIRVEAGEAGAKVATVSCSAASAGSLQSGVGAGPLDLLLVYYDPAAQDVKIQRGENRGRTLPHLNIVTDVQKIGQLLPDGEQTFKLKEPRKGLRAALLLQDGPGGPILAAARV